jgi:hypothetical protein
MKVFVHVRDYEKLSWRVTWIKMEDGDAAPSKETANGDVAKFISSTPQRSRSQGVREPYLQAVRDVNNKLQYVWLLIQYHS